MPLITSLWCAAVSAAPADVSVRALTRLMVHADGEIAVPFLIVNSGAMPADVTVTFSSASAELQPVTTQVRLEGKGWQVVPVRCSLPVERDSAVIVAQVAGDADSVLIRRGLDLTTMAWKRQFTPTASADRKPLTSPETFDGDWPEIRIPGLWEEKQFGWCRLNVTVPASWQGKKVRLVMGAVDDNDVTYWNGVEIGRTYGWDIRREYVIPAEHMRWNASNVLTVMVENLAYGGGLYKPPVMLLTGDDPVDPPPAKTPASAARPPQGAIGKPLPLRRMRVQDGVLRYPEGTEVALWGVNIYPQSWHQYENMKHLKVDFKATIRQDLDHLQEMGIEVIRMHIFDREITDGQGNILDNEHLDILDYLVSECSRRGIYLFLTPIAWWGGPNENKASFSAQTSKPGMMLVPSALDAAANYLQQFLSRRNRYSGRAYKDEPALCILEIMNEPAYFLYGDVHGEGYLRQGEPPEILRRDRAELRRQWEEWLAQHNLGENPVLFAYFRYDRMRRYLNRMVTAIRSTGAQQPIACSFVNIDPDDLLEAVADSDIEALTFSNYPGGWDQVNDGRNLMYYAAPLKTDPRLAKKARLAYEFDTPATNTSCYLFPALAAYFRSGEVQIACQFQYDSVATAKWNVDWFAHWLNWLYTPTKAVSFMIAGEAFRALPRGVSYDVGTWNAPAPTLQIGPMWTSFAANNSAFVTSSQVLYARSPGNSVPLPWPLQPERIVGTGSSRYVEYAGTGAYIIERVGQGRLRLSLNPDARLVGNSHSGSFHTPVAELEYNRHLFRLKLPGWSRARCLPEGGGPPPPAIEGGWLLKPGRYVIIK